MTAQGKSISQASSATIEAIRAKLALTGLIAGSFTTALPTGTIAMDRIYVYAGIDNTTIGGIAWRNGDSALYNGSTWTRIPFQSLSNYRPISILDKGLKNFIYVWAGTNLAVDTTYADGYIYSNGSIIASSSYQHSDYINILGQNSITVSNHRVSVNSYLAFYDINKNLLSPLYAGTVANATLTPPSNAAFVRGTVNLGTQLIVIAGNDYDIIKNSQINNSELISTVNTHASKLNYSDAEFCKNIFDNELCIGGSATQGWRVTGIFPNQSYPHYLAKMTGWTVENAGWGGFTPKLWFSEKFSLYNYLEFDVVIICLGQNEGLTDTITADTSSGDYNTYANTNTGQYCRLIEAIKAINPRIKIYLFTLQDGSISGTATWDVVFKIGAKYGLKVWSNQTNCYNDVYSNIDYHPHEDPIHFGTAGNLALADLVFHQIAKDVLDNIGDYSIYKET